MSSVLSEGLKFTRHWLSAQLQRSAETPWPSKGERSVPAPLAEGEAQAAIYENAVIDGIRSQTVEQPVVLDYVSRPVWIGAAAVVAIIVLGVLLLLLISAMMPDVDTSH
jgi:hypothetical protein